jgi:hypothetical protein
MREPKQVVSLCPACDSCPSVEIYEDGLVRIGEDPNVVALSAAEWNELVRAVKRGDLAELPVE